MITDIQNELLDGKAFAPRLAEILVELSALSGNVADRVVECESTYNVIYNLTLDLTENNKPITAAKAKIKAMATTEYLELQKAKATEATVTQMIGAIKYLIRVKENEERNSRTQ